MSTTDHPDYLDNPGAPVVATATAIAVAGADVKLVAVTAQQAIRLWWLSLSGFNTNMATRGAVSCYVDTAPHQSLSFVLIEPATTAEPEKDVNEFQYYGGIILPRGANLWLSAGGGTTGDVFGVAGYDLA